MGEILESQWMSDKICSFSSTWTDEAASLHIVGEGMDEKQRMAVENDPPIKQQDGKCFTLYGIQYGV